jgi:hypothetical protein
MLEHGGEYPDTMPQAIKLIDAEGRSCIYVPIMQNGKVVDSQMPMRGGMVSPPCSTTKPIHATARFFAERETFPFRGRREISISASEMLGASNS